MSLDLDQLLRDASPSPSRPVDPVAIRTRSVQRTARTRVASAGTGVLLLATAALLWPPVSARPTIEPASLPSPVPEAPADLGDTTDDELEEPEPLASAEDEFDGTAGDEDDATAAEPGTEPAPPAGSPPPGTPAPAPAPTTDEPAADEAVIDHGAPLWGRWFRASHLQDGGTTRPVAGDRPLYVGFRREAAGDTIVWMASCNTHGSDVVVGAERLELSGIGGTQRGCEPQLEEEDGWLAAFFADGPRWELDDDHLRLRTGDGGIDLVEDPEGPGPPWS